jgi:hypothetical protein
MLRYGAVRTQRNTVWEMIPFDPLVPGMSGVVPGAVAGVLVCR